MKKNGMLKLVSSLFVMGIVGVACKKEALESPHRSSNQENNALSGNRVSSGGKLDGLKPMTREERDLLIAENRKIAAENRKIAAENHALTQLNREEKNPERIEDNMVKIKKNIEKIKQKFFVL